MLHQVMFSGNVKKGNSPIISRDDAERVCDHAKACDYTGFTLYVDGNYITLYEGTLDKIQKSIDYYSDSMRYSKIMTMISRPVEQREFKDFTLCLRHIDSADAIRHVKNCQLLTSDISKRILPKSTPKEYKSLLKTFARVNNLRAFEVAA